MATDSQMPDAPPVTTVGELPPPAVVEQWTEEQLFEFVRKQGILRNDKNRATFQNAEISGRAFLRDGDVRHYWSQECQLPLGPSGDLAELVQRIKDPTIEAKEAARNKAIKNEILPAPSVVEGWTAQELFDFILTQGILGSQKSRETFKDAEIDGKTFLERGHIEDYWRHDCGLPLGPSGQLARLVQRTKGSASQAKQDERIKTIPRPVTPVGRRTSVAGADIRATPVKATSASHYSPLSTLEDVTPRLENELKRHIWFSKSGNMSFFDRFFPGVGGLPAPGRFPDPPHQNDVIEWFKAYDKECRKVMKLENRGPFLETSANQPLRHPTVNRKLDLFLYAPPEGSKVKANVVGQDATDTNQSAGSKKKKGKKEYDWNYVHVIAELKCEKGLMDLNSKVVLQLAGYARHVFLCQPDRQFVHGFTVINSTLRCWVYARSGAFASSSVDLSTPQGLSVFCRVYKGYLGMSFTEMGFAVDPATTATSTTSATTAAPDTITIGDRKIIRGEPFFTTHAIVTRGTTCWTARPTDSKSTELPWVLKVSWRYPGREHEGIMLQSCHKHKVKGVAEYIAHDEGLRIHKILGDQYIESAVPHDLRWKINKGPSPNSLRNSGTQSHTPDAAAARKAPTASENLRNQVAMTSIKRQLPDDSPNELPGYPHKRAKLSDSSPRPLPSLRNSTEERQMTGQDEPVDEVGSEAVAGAAEIPIPDRISTRVLMSRGKPVDEFTDPVELLLAMHDAVRGHRSLLIDGHILHRDISVNNIMITIASHPRADGFHGFLIDLDHAIGADAIGRHSSVPERTGTFVFMSIDALKNNPSFRHIYYDDLQSFMWVYLWLIIRDRANCPALRHWSSNNEPAVIGHIKAGQVGSDEDFEVQLASWFDENLGLAVSKAAKDLRRALFPVGERKELEREDVRDKLYEKVIKAFDDALVVAEEEAKTLKKRVVVPRNRMAY